MTYYCKHSGRVDTVKCKTASGHWQLRKLCLECSSVFGPALAQKNLDLKYFREFDTGYKNPPCAVLGCNETETALHHFMPRSIAIKNLLNADDWPQAYFCRKHHALWHALITVGLLRDNWKG